MKKNETVFIKETIDFNDLYTWLDEIISKVFNRDIFDKDIVEQEIKKGFVKYLVDGFEIENTDSIEILSDKDVNYLYEANKNNWILNKVRKLAELKIDKIIIGGNV